MIQHLKTFPFPSQWRISATSVQAVTLDFATAKQMFRLIHKNLEKALIGISSANKL